MRYLASEGMEQIEAVGLPALFGKAYDPNGEVGLDDTVGVDAPGLEFVELDGETLAIVPDTVSWAFLNEREADFVKMLNGGARLGALKARWPADGLDAAERFVGQLYRRGMVRLNGQAAVDPTIFRDSANVEEGRLIELLITEKCNLACGYCLAGANQSLPHMSEEIARTTVDRAFDMDGEDGLTFEFSGGEPMLRFDMVRGVVDYIRSHPKRRDRHVYICVQTNGTLLDAERVDWLARNEVQVGLSIDGDPRSHNLSRPQVNGKGSFDKVLNGLDLLQRAGIASSALVVLNRSNIGSVEALIEFLLENGIRWVKLNPVAYLGTARAAWDAFGLEPEEVIDYFDRFVRTVVARQCDIFEANWLDMTRHLVSKRRESRCLRGHCGAGDSFNAIAADGTIYPCGRATQSPGLALGNVMTETGALNAAGARNEHIQAIKARRPDTLDDCKTCTYRELCQAGCSVQAYERHGTVRHKTPECQFNKTLYPRLMRWLAFDQQAVDHANRSSYFSAQRLTIAGHDFL